MKTLELKTYFTVYQLHATLRHPFVLIYGIGIDVLKYLQNF